MQLSATEARVLGSLMEKEITTPEYYPLSLNALVNASNQKSSREPVMQLTEQEVRTALRTLEDKELVSVDHGSRVERYENRARTVFQLRRDETAILCLLLLRGPQTPGELRSRSDRLFTFDDISAVGSALQRLSTTQPEAAGRSAPLVAALPRQPGSREERFRQLLSPAHSSAQLPAQPSNLPPGQPHSDLSSTEATLPAAASSAATPQDTSPTPLTPVTMAEAEGRIRALEDVVTQLQGRLQSLEEQLGVHRQEAS